MNDEDAAELALLSEAMLKAQHLVDELRKAKAETDASPPDLPPDQLAQGKHAMEMAVKSAERMLEALHQAAAAHPSNDDQLPA